jgi:Fe-S-cluster-containing hydrogenase component 2
MAVRSGADEKRFRLPAMTNPQPQPVNELRGRRSLDASSPVFMVDHSACILCERCIRACDEVRENHVIGRTGKGPTAGIGFDLNNLMGQSSCVQCGECMVSCPTSAITFKPVAQIKLPRQSLFTEALPAEELIRDPVFAGVPPKFLLWQKGLVIRRKVKAGEVLCRQGDAGNTAFLIKSGKLEVTVYPTTTPGSERSFGGLLQREKPLFRFELTPADMIVGEMACLSGSPRSATVRALASGEVWEVRRNVLDRLMRLPSQRDRFETAYRDRSLSHILQEADLFRGIGAEAYQNIVGYLRERLKFVRVKPGQVLFAQGDRVEDLYLIRLGHVRIGVERFGNETKVMSLGPGAFLGEVGLLGLTEQDADRTAEEVEQNLMAALEQAGDNLTAAFPAGVQSATVSALGHLELARLSRADFLLMVKQYADFRRRLVRQSIARLRSELRGHALVHEFVEQGLYEGKSILVLDTDLCTRCDECTKGCVEQHGTESHGIPLTRLLRDGVRFSHYVVATSCRSCADPHCMFGCPVDSIHRGRHLQIVIEDHCIGCGLCADNCPYGSIFMAPNEKRRVEIPNPERPGHNLLVARPKAVVCDLCDAEGDRSTPEPRCVAACPHEAAHRMMGNELLSHAMERAAKGK